MKSQSYSKLSPVFIVSNIIVSFLILTCIMLYAEQTAVKDAFDIFIETSKTVIHFFLFCVCAALRMQYRYKAFLLVGLFFTQVGMGLDTLDEFYEFSHPSWHLWGDLVYLTGLIFVSIGTITWGIAAHRAAIKDTLTGAYNRKYFDSLLDHYTSKVKRQSSQVCLVCLDLDNFKNINDTYGHTVGDKVLISVAQTLIKNGREVDVVCRTGGEEFEVLMPGTTGLEAEEASKRLLKLISVNTPPSIASVTASIGVTALTPEDSVMSVRKRADDAMYSAKNSGKNRVVFFSKMPSSEGKVDEKIDTNNIYKI